MCDWSDVQVAQGEPLRARRMWSRVDYLHALTQVADPHRLCRTVDVLDKFLRMHGSAIKWCWRQPRFRILCYRVQATIRHLYEHMYQSTTTCPSAEHDHEVLRRTVRELWTRYQGPHCTDMHVYMHLKQQLSNDLALRIFEYV